MAQGNVENWLGVLLKGSLYSVHCVIREAAVAISDPNCALIDFFNQFPAQVCQCSVYMHGDRTP